MDPQTFETQLNAMFDRGESAERIRAFVANSGFQMAPEDNQHLDNYERSRQKGPTGQTGVVRDNRNPNTAYQNSDATGAGLLGAVNGITAGALPYAGAVVDTLGGTAGRDNLFNSKRGVADLLRYNLNANEQALNGVQEDHPYAYTGGEIAGVVGGIGMSALGAARGASALMTAGEKAPAAVEALGRYAAPRVEGEAVQAATGGAFNPEVAAMLSRERAAAQEAASFNPEVASMLGREKALGGADAEIQAMNARSNAYQQTLQRPGVQADVELGNASPHLAGSEARNVEQSLSDGLARQMNSRTVRAQNRIVEGDAPPIEDSFSPEMAAQIRQWKEADAARQQAIAAGRMRGPNTMSPNPRFR